MVSINNVYKILLLASKGMFNIITFGEELSIASDIEN